MFSLLLTKSIVVLDEWLQVKEINKLLLFSPSEEVLKKLAYLIMNN